MAILDMFKSKPAAPEPSLYQAICGAIRDDGTLPRDFSLPRPAPADPEAPRFADGAWDGICMYHMAPPETPPDIAPLAAFAGLITAEKYSEAEECLRLFFSTDDHPTMLRLIDPFQEWIIQHKDQISPAHLLEFSVHLLKESRDIESVKFALTCLELLNLDGRPDVRNLVQVLALSDEFALFCIFVMGSWPNAGEAIFDVAQHVFGWGRIHAVARLAAESDEVRRWLLLEGWNNDVLPQYSALACAQKSGLIERVKAADLDGEETLALAKLLPALLDEGPVVGISGIEDAPAFLADCLAVLQSYAAQHPDQAAVQAAIETLTSAQSDAPAD